MERVLTLTQEQFDKFENSSNQNNMAKKLLNIPANNKIKIGTAVVRIPYSKALEVYLNTRKGQDCYYLIIKPIDRRGAMAYSFNIIKDSD